MTPNEVITEMLSREKVSQVEFSKRLGNSKNFTSAILAQKREPKTQTMARYCDILGYDLIVRSRTDDTEFTISP